MLAGLIKSRYRVTVGEHRVGASLKRANPEYAEARLQKMGRQVHPPIYVCAGFGQNLHIDQNEKVRKKEIILSHIIQAEQASYLEKTFAYFLCLSFLCTFLKFIFGRRLHVHHA